MLNRESRAAHIQVQPTTQQTRARIMDFATQRGVVGFTCDELATAWCCSPNHTAPRCTELLKSGRLVATERTRPTRAGSSARVLVARRFAPEAIAMPASDTQSLFGDLRREVYPD